MLNIVKQKNDITSVLNEVNRTVADYSITQILGIDTNLAIRYKEIVNAYKQFYPKLAISDMSTKLLFTNGKYIMKVHHIFVFDIDTGNDEIIENKVIQLNLPIHSVDNSFDLDYIYAEYSEKLRNEMKNILQNEYVTSTEKSNDINDYLTKECLESYIKEELHSHGITEINKDIVISLDKSEGFRIDLTQLNIYAYIHYPNTEQVKNYISKKVVTPPETKNKRITVANIEKMASIDKEISTYIKANTAWKWLGQNVSNMESEYMSTADMIQYKTHFLHIPIVDYIVRIVVSYNKVTDSTTVSYNAHYDTESTAEAIVNHTVVIRDNTSIVEELVKLQRITETLIQLEQNEINSELSKEGDK